MFLFTLVLGVLFLPEADSLKCTCEGNRYGVCSTDTTQCPSQNYSCSAATEVTSLDDKVTELNSKGCIESELCLDYSVSNGVYRVLQKTSCCSGDLCNANITYPKPDYTPNGKKCFSCAGDENCMKTLNCVGDESHCFTVTGNAQGVTMMMKGCASDKECSDKSTSVSSGLLPGSEVSCCQGNYCNSASTPSPALLLLLVPLLFSNLFS
ncbi:urokinase plasminogen activator surface receptor-like [Gambusia affinis]|uniref:urokinase plasminogen activator surface receptor-like n=1 Tax=Gambusia affinis TaxID=33528 RepID=UPI001CDBF8C3|nr:urokinase plasminogen activator surface receptor-like [Gambusia affinis]